MKSAVSINQLPVSLQDVAETLGLPIVLKLIEHFGGAEIKFPKHPADDHPVLLALGKEDGKALCEFLSGGFIYVPHGKARKSIQRDVLTLQDQGKERREIARLLGVSQRHVRRMANKSQDANQLSLFSES